MLVPKPSKTEKNKGLEGQQCTHPTVKPIKLFQYLITLGSRPGDIILDPYSGSGTTGIAARLIDRQFICFEMSGEYNIIAKARHKGFTKDINKLKGLDEFK